MNKFSNISWEAADHIMALPTETVQTSKCGVCNGSGVVGHGFVDGTNHEICERCKNCGGAGVIWTTRRPA